MTTEKTTVTAQFITTTNLKKMNTVKLTRLAIRVLGETAVTYTDRQTLIYRINSAMVNAAVAMVEAMVGFRSEDVEREMNELAAFYHNFATAFKEHMVEIKMENVAAISGWRFDMTWKLIKGGLKNQEIASILTSEKYPVTAKDVANVRYGQVKDNMKKRATRKVNSIETDNTEIFVEHVAEGFFGGLGLIDLNTGVAIGF